LFTHFKGVVKIKNLIISILLVAIMFFLASVIAEAKDMDILYCYYPDSVYDVISTEFSTGGGDKAVVLLELTGYEYDEGVVTYVAQLGSVSGFLGIGRFAVPDKIVYNKWDKDYMVLQKEK